MPVLIAARERGVKGGGVGRLPVRRAATLPVTLPVSLPDPRCCSLFSGEVTFCPERAGHRAILWCGHRALRRSLFTPAGSAGRRIREGAAPA